MDGVLACTYSDFDPAEGGEDDGGDFLLLLALLVTRLLLRLGPLLALLFLRSHRNRCLLPSCF